jgi:large subunit GTPase 1
MNHKGMPDVNRGARYILKDYVSGKLLFCYPPPDIDTFSFQEHRYEVSKEIKYLERLKKNQAKVILRFGSG